MSVLSGTFADFKIIKTRSVVQVIIEVPIEQAKAVTDAFGFPLPGKEIHVALARLNMEPERKKLTPKTPFKSLPRSQQAALACRDVAFQRWFRTSGEEDTARAVRVALAIKSRSELDTPGLQSLHGRWDELYARFEEETGRVPA